MTEQDEIEAKQTPRIDRTDDGMYFVETVTGGVKVFKPTDDAARWLDNLFEYTVGK